MGLEIAGAFLIPVAVAAMAVVTGGVVLWLIGKWFVDQTLSTAEGCAVLFGVVTLFALTLLLPVALKLLPPLVGAACFWYGRLWFTVREAQARQEHLEREEQRARALVERDPTAAVGYERLAKVYLELDRPEDALAAWRSYQELVPRDPQAARWIRRLEAQLSERSEPAPPVVPSGVTAAFAPDLVIDADVSSPELEVHREEPEPAAFAPSEGTGSPPPGEDRQLEAFAPPEEPAEPDGASAGEDDGAISTGGWRDTGRKPSAAAAEEAPLAEFMADPDDDRPAFDRPHRDAIEPAAALPEEPEGEGPSGSVFDAEE